MDADDILTLRTSVRRFLEREVPPETVQAWDREDRIDRRVLKGIAQLGVCGLCVPEEYGGMGREVVAMSAVIEELSRHSIALGILYIMNASYGGLNIAESGSPGQKARFLPGLLEGDLAFAYGLSEPDVGADLTRVKTRATRHGDTVVIEGSKRWTTGADIADYIYALVRSAGPEQHRNNLSFVLIPTHAKGVSITRLEAMGTNGCALHDVVLDKVEVPFDHVIGEEAGWNNGWTQLAGPALEIEKLSPSAMGLGIAEAAMAEAWAYSQQRVQGGKHICGHQSVRHVLAQAQTDLQACRLMMEHAAGLVERGEPSAVATSMAKLFIAETGKKIVLDCQQYVMGAYGYARGFNMERHVRDVLAVPIYGGSTAIQRNNIANLMKLPRE